jgi:hypothetical protein
MALTAAEELEMVADAQIAVLGETVSYTPIATRTAVSVAAMVEYGVSELDDSGNFEAQDLAWIAQDVLTPRRDDEVTVGTETFRVDRFIEDGRLWRLTLRLVQVES